MEKKTIGSFIAALRKANGMTQQEVADKLNISNKAISRWERDECAPDLSLIPALAEIFGVTCDELLRGERNNPDRGEAYSEETANKQKAKSDKQFKLMLDTRSRKHKNLTLISIGITILGLIAAMIANLGFSKGLIAFGIAAAFCVASEICQICFAINARMMIDEDDDSYIGRINEANTNVTKTATVVSFINILSAVFCLPLVTLIDGAVFGMVFEDWLSYGLLFSVIAFSVCYVLYALFVRRYLRTRKLIVPSDEKSALFEKNERLLRKTVLISACIALVFVIVVGISYGVEKHNLKQLEKGIEFDNWSDFKAYVESEYDRWYEEGYTYIDSDGNRVMIGFEPIIGPDEEDDYYPNKEYEKYINRFGEVVFEYYYNPDLYRSIWFTETEDGNIQSVTVRTNQAYLEAQAGFGINLALFLASIAVDFVIAASIYLIKANKNKQKAK